MCVYVCVFSFEHFERNLAFTHLQLGRLKEPSLRQLHGQVWRIQIGQVLLVQGVEHLVEKPVAQLQSPQDADEDSRLRKCVVSNLPSKESISPRLLQHIYRHQQPCSVPTLVICCCKITHSKFIMEMPAPHITISGDRLLLIRWI